METNGSKDPKFESYIVTKPTLQEELRIMQCLVEKVGNNPVFCWHGIFLILDETTVKAFESVLSQCESHLGRPVSKFLYRRDDGSTTAYVKLKTSKGEILYKFYENGKEIDPLAYEDKPYDLKATLAIEGLAVGNNVNLQVKIHDANVRPKTYEHVRLVDLEW